jgi:DNA-binding XRE family transcriptional regulator
VSLDRRLRLQEVRATYEANPHDNPVAQEWLVASVESLLIQADEELAEYEALRDGVVTTVPATDLGDLPAVLVKARIAAGLTQRQLAERLGVAEQSVQRDEAGGYARAGLDRLRRVAEALGLELHGTFHLPRRDESRAASD